MLGLSYNGIASEGVCELALVLGHPNSSLHRLLLDGNESSPYPFPLFWPLQTGYLTELSVSIGPAHLDHLLQALRHPRCELTRLRLAPNERNFDLHPLVDIPFISSKLLGLEFYGAHVEFRFLASLKDRFILHPTNLKSLAFSDCWLTDAMVLILSRLLARSILTHLDLSYNELITERGFLCLARVVQQTSTESLDFTGTNLSRGVFNEFIRLLQNVSTTKLQWVKFDLCDVLEDEDRVLLGQTIQVTRIGRGLLGLASARRVPRLGAKVKCAVKRVNQDILRLLPEFLI